MAVPTEFPKPRSYAKRLGTYSGARARARSPQPGNNMEITAGSREQDEGLTFESQDLSDTRGRTCRRCGDSKPQDRPKKRRESTSRFSFIDLSTMESLFRSLKLIFKREQNR